MNTLTSEYELLENAFFGTGGFKDGCYLIQHKRETTENYSTRKEIAYYLNYLKPIVGSHVNPIFRKEADRNIEKSGKLFQRFLADVDGAGAGMHGFMKMAALTAKLKQVAFIVVDNDREVATRRSEELQDRKMPYCYIIDASRIEDLKMDKHKRLKEITYTITDPDDKNKTAYKTWTEVSWEEWRKTSDQGGRGVIASGEHGLGVLPIAPLFGAKPKPGDYLPEPDFYQIAKICQRIYNLRSEIDEAMRNQAFNVLTYPGTDLKSLGIGTNNALGYDPEARHKPDFIAPDTAPMEEQRKDLSLLISEIYRMAQLSFATGVQEQKSGVAKAWDFEDTNTTLTDFADNCEEVERRIALIFGKYVNESSLEYTPSYPDEFGVIDVQAELDEVSSALYLNIGGKFNKEIKKKAARSVFHKNKELVGEIEADIDQMQEDEIQAEGEDGQSGMQD